ncbi:hypothetical protein AB0C96_00875 [Streptomyces sp. NPDC048506]|uniref:hypothetical protein n=1 Tax=Streptomyces sp. NPDC048506 TaxID=3155028 RepID=UPI003427DF07
MSTPTLSRPSVAGTPQPDRRTRHPLYAEVRSGPARWAALAAFLTPALSLAAKAAYWQGSWGHTQLQLHIAAVLLGGPLAAAAGCWQGGREHRSRTTELRVSGTRGPLAQFLVSAAPVVLGVLAGYVLAAAGALAATWPYVSSGRPHASLPAADAMFLAAMTMGGMVVGRLVRWRLAAPALAGLAYVALALPTHQKSALRFLSPATTHGGGDALPVWWQPLAMAAWTAGIAAAAVLAYAARRHWYAALPALAIAAAAAVPLMRSGEDMWHLDPAGKAEVCDDSSPRVCVNALNRGLLPEVSRALSGITSRLDGVANAPTRFEDLHRAPRSGEAELPTLSLGQSVVRGALAEPEQFAWEAAAALTSRDCDTFPTQRTDDAVRDWLASNSLSERRRQTAEETAREWGNATATADAQAGARALSHLTAMRDDQRRAWLGRYFATAGRCDVSGVPAL